jgi:hypothetical protein
MDPGPHQEHHTHHHSGTRWLDMLVGLSAIMISVISLWVAVQHGKTMEHMVEATTWPYLEFGTSNLQPDGGAKTSLFVQNNGVGPAKIESFELSYKGKPLANGADLLNACCVPPGGQRPHYVSGTVLDKVVPAKDGILIFRENSEEMTPEQHAQMNAARKDLRAHICFCSVLEECWIRDSAERKAVKTKSCPEPKVPYNDQ